jgi:4-alpha-glucanotransferase
MKDLSAVAALWGVETGYHDVFGTWHDCSPETLTRLVVALSGGRDKPPYTDIAVRRADVTRAFAGDGRRLWLLAVQLYGLRSRRNWGHGDFSDLARLIALAASRGAAGIGLNPLHALFPDRAEQASPYAPNSRHFLNLLYVDVQAIPEFPGVAAAGLEAEVAALCVTDMVDYGRVAEAKLRGLRFAYDRFKTKATAQRRADFEVYRKQQGDTLLRFACFECLRGRYEPMPWPQWPQPWRNPDRGNLLALRKAHLNDCEFQEFTQWIADRQLQTCQDTARRHTMPIGLYIDLAVGIHPHGADAWSQQDVVLADVSVGAPTDEFNRAGQDWGLVPFNPNALAANGFEPVRGLMGAVMRHAGAIRLDHVLGLNRLYMIPRGSEAADGAYVRFPFEPLLRVIAEESNRYRCIVIGEDLGTVPENFRETLSRWGLWTYRVMLFERQHDGSFRPPEAYPAEALATFNTHDLPAFRGWLQAHDLRLKRAIGVDPGEIDEARARSQQALRAILAEWVPDYAADDFAAVAAFLAAAPSRLVAVALDDVLGVIDQVNIPGTVDQHPNWRRKLPVPLEDLDNHDGLLRVARAFAQAGRSIAR